ESHRAVVATAFGDLVHVHVDGEAAALLKTAVAELTGAAARSNARADSDAGTEAGACPGAETSATRRCGCGRTRAQRDSGARADRRARASAAPRSAAGTVQRDAEVERREQRAWRINRHDRPQPCTRSVPSPSRAICSTRNSSGSAGATPT